MLLICPITFFVAKLIKLRLTKEEEEEVRSSFSYLRRVLIHYHFEIIISIPRWSERELGIQDWNNHHNQRKLKIWSQICGD